MKTTHVIASGLASVALLVTLAAPSLASAQQYFYPTSYYTVSTPYNCGSYWSSQPCAYSNSYATPVYQYSYPTYTYPQYQYQGYPYQYQTWWYGNGSNYGYGYRYGNNVCPVGYYLWGKNCWPNPSNNGQFWYPAH